MRNGFHYSDEHQQCISFPLGGIGSGSIGLGGNGRLIDWEIFNRPGKGQFNGLSHFSIKAEDGNEVVEARVLNGDLQPPFEGPLGTPHFYEGFGWGPMRQTLSGMPHFARNTFEGKFPVAELGFNEEIFPGSVTMKAFNPFIPHQEDDSSIPGAFFVFQITNTTDKTLDYTLTSVLANPYHGVVQNRLVQKDGVTGILMEGLDPIPGDYRAGNICVSTDAKDVSWQQYLYRGSWFDSLEVYWNDLMRSGAFQDRQYDPKKREATDHPTLFDHGLLASRVSLAPGESKDVRFMISWYHPENRFDWESVNDAVHKRLGEEGMAPYQKPWKNYYATLWSSSFDAATYGFKNWEGLQRATEAFRDALYNSSLPQAALDAIGANLSILKTPTVWRLEDGTLYGWEGNGEKGGSCEGSCTHVWSYAQALPFLFPALSRSMRQAEFNYGWWESGELSFRLMLPLGAPKWGFRGAADGHFATILKAYREWKFSGDQQWLASLWPRIKRSVEFAWSKENDDLWDPEREGILSGRQHHTLDMELFSANSWLSGMYLAALKAASEMAEAMDEPETKDEYLQIFERGQKTLNTELYNGQYFIQKIDFRDKGFLERFNNESERISEIYGKRDIFDLYWSEEHGQIKYQYGEGCSIDQMLGQWHADLYDLGDVFDPSQVDSALKALFEINFKETMRNHYNPCRVYCLNDESGLVICAWPKDKEKPEIAPPYTQETMHGFEYSAADLMIKRGFIAEGMKVVEALRERYDGRRRNPWNEFECGSNYARSMASYALLQSFSGVHYDGRTSTLSIHPLEQKDGQFLWSLGCGWGIISIKKGHCQVSVLGGHLSLRRITQDSCVYKRIQINGVSQNFHLVRNTHVLEFEQILQTGQSVEMKG
ncbi:MAG: non-lysosomal glucosylceramidase [Spirochaetales bacterium]|nr:non-lysosomal glucosylceramidase [Spirochaetales bacterium]